MPGSSFNNRAVFRLTGLTVVAALCGCTEPAIDRPGTWRATGVNDRNLSAMLVNPADATAGIGAQTTRGDSSARAVTRLLIDKRRPLLNVTTARIGATADTPADPALPTGGGSGAGGGASQ